MYIRNLQKALAIFSPLVKAEIEARDEELIVYKVPPDSLGRGMCNELHRLGWVWDGELECWRAYT